MGVGWGALRLLFRSIARVGGVPQTPVMGLYCGEFTMGKALSAIFGALPFPRGLPPGDLFAS